MQTSFHGYRRENGRVGVRNHVVVLPLDDLSNAACEAGANNINRLVFTLKDEEAARLDALRQASAKAKAKAKATARPKRKPARAKAKK